MKPAFPLVFFSLAFFVMADESTDEVYPEDYPEKSYVSFLEDYGKPAVIELGTGERPRHIIHFAENEEEGHDVVNPILPPNFSETEEVMYCYWTSAPRDTVCVWFRRVEGEWVSFWHSAQSNRLFEGIYIRADF